MLINSCATYSAEPGIFFLDKANEMTNAKGYGQKVVCTNPCGEQPLAPYSVCNLGAINLSNFVDKKKLKKLQDNIIDITPYFLEENKQQALVTAYETSIQLAKEKGSFPFLTDRDQFVKSGFLKTMPKEIIDGIKQYGIRNSHLITVAPTGSTGTMVKQVEEIYSYLYNHGAKGGTVYVDGSRDSQILSLEKEENLFEEEFIKTGAGSEKATDEEIISKLNDENTILDNTVRKIGSDVALVPYYVGDDPIKSKVAAALMPGFLLYGGFYLPFYLSARAKLPNTSDIIRLILRDKVIHNYYSGYKYQRKVEKLSIEKQAEMKEFVFDLLYKLIDLEKAYLRKFLQNLGYESPFTVEETKIAPEIFNQLSARADENHDFFSGNGSSYVMGTTEETTDDDWEF
ncbi:hypothetical protein FQA39_LY12837 [Lamprigera yunnana]|nr:hypothetical protein FQA39_LY12837 [Lamprigera yunnana]